MTPNPTPGLDAPPRDPYREDLARLADETLRLPLAVGARLRRDLLDELAWIDRYPDDAPLREALAWIRGARP